jgi:thiol-disulfide isomerase/thioredoxin
MKKLTLLLILLSINISAWAFDQTPFSKAAFDTAQNDGRVVLVDIYASWCPTCERQQWILEKYFEENPESKILVLVVDYDQQKEWVKYFKAPRQSSLYLYKNNEQLWFSVAETRKRIIHETLDKFSKAEI